MIVPLICRLRRRETDLLHYLRMMLGKREFATLWALCEDRRYIYSLAGSTLAINDWTMTGTLGRWSDLEYLEPAGTESICLLDNGSWQSGCVTVLHEGITKLCCVDPKLGEEHRKRINLADVRYMLAPWSWLSSRIGTLNRKLLSGFLEFAERESERRGISTAFLHVTEAEILLTAGGRPIAKLAASAGVPLVGELSALHGKTLRVGKEVEAEIEVSPSLIRLNFKKVEKSGTNRRAWVLLVDDDAFFLKVLSRHLQSRGVQVLTASTLNEAILKWRTNEDTIAAIVCDYRIAECSGLTLLELTRSGARGPVPFAGISASRRDECELLFLQHGADAFFSKVQDARLLDSWILKYVLPDTAGGVP